MILTCEAVLTSYEDCALLAKALCMLNAKGWFVKAETVNRLPETEKFEKPKKKMKCRLCGKNVFETGGYLHRVNEKGVEGVWECRPSCEAKLSNEDAFLMAVMGKENEKQKKQLKNIKGI